MSVTTASILKAWQRQIRLRQGREVYRPTQAEAEAVRLAPDG